MKGSGHIRLIGLCVGLMVLLSLPAFSAGQSEEGPVELKIATILPEDSELGDAIKQFESMVEDRSNDEIDVVPFFGAVLGEERSVVEQLTTNDVQMNVGGSGVMIWHAPEYYITGIPFLFESGQEVLELTNKLLEEIVVDEIIDRVGVRVLGGSLRAPRNLVTVNRRVEKPEDVVGLNMRLPTHESWVKAWSALGAHPQAIPGSEQFSAIQMGVVEATENPMSTLYNMQLTEPTNYLILTEHLHELRMWSISEEFYQGLSDEHRQIVDESAAEAIEYLTLRNLEVDAEYLALIEEQGLEIVTPDKQAFREAVIPIVDELRQDWAPGLYEQYVAPLLN